MLSMRIKEKGENPPLFRLVVPRRFATPSHQSERSEKAKGDKASRNREWAAICAYTIR